MNRPAEPLLSDAAALAWSERNQRWLSQRLAGWRQRIEQHGDAAARPHAAPPDDDAADFEPAALQVASLFGLSVFETELLLLAAGVEIDAALRDAVGAAQGTAPGQAVRLSFSLALALLPQAHWDALSPSGPLREWSLVHFDSEAGFSRALLRIDERVLHHVTGVAAFDERLTGLAQFADPPPIAAPDDSVRSIAAALSAAGESVVMLASEAPEASGRRASGAVACAVFQRLGLRTLCADVSAFASACNGDPREIARTARRLDREAALAGAGITLALPRDSVHGAVAVQLINALRSPLIVLGMLSAAELAELPARRVLRFDVPRPPPQRHTGLAPAMQAAADRALQQFHVDPAFVEQALAGVAAIADADAAQRALWNALRSAARGGLDTLAQRITSHATFDDLVLPPFVLSQLREIASQVGERRTVYDKWGFAACHSRGLGIAALFAGESGTGKTLAAEAIANELRLDLYRIDLANVVSKYIGETEKNLSRLFDAAQASGAILLFDEADALFGKRSEVKDSHDRYANIEVAYLLQRVECYRGLAILTSNMKNALDRAFLRRIRFVVQFPFPDSAARGEIWRRAFPAAAPMETLDWPQLARLNLAGGNIRNIAVNAAFAAAARGTPIDSALVHGAARAEFAKLERVPGDAAGALKP
ncbi:ATP-binding protein [Piscinibacter sp.]|uniref:ATP-binding protein n=1 Tax=Piscinibacter sp. TaxID=1903157 RepID=UPI00355A4CC4